MANIQELINYTIIKMIEEANASNQQTKYRQPLIGYASAHDPQFSRLKKFMGKDYFLPTDLLPNAQTVVAFFLPFTEDLIKICRKSSQVTKEWAVAYIETNQLIDKISQQLKETLESKGISAATQKPTYVFNKETLAAAWSHKSAAYIAGLGRFGLHQMLITSSGCAGRFGSIVISASIPATPQPKEEFCAYYKASQCQSCVTQCPTGALTVEGLNKKKCYAYLREIDRQYSGLQLCDVCGRCAIGPCALQPC